MFASQVVKGAVVTTTSVALIQGISWYAQISTPITAPLQALTTAVAFIATSIFSACSEFKSASNAYLAGFVVCTIALLATLVIADPDGQTLQQFMVAAVALLVSTIHYKAYIRN